MKTPLFITFEGGEGAGKSTQVARLAERLRQAGHDVVTTREPGGSPDADAIRELLVTGEPGRWSPTADALLNYAARDSHLGQTIRPALQSGKTVICDRFSDSTRAYQGIAGGIGLNLIEAIDREIVGETQPDLTLVFDLDPEIGLMRAKTRGGADRFERLGLSFHVRLRKAFLHIANEHPDRCQIIDATGTPEEVEQRIWQVVSTRMALEQP
ncbi:MAG: dTMP kinase [Anderseniella sp.]|nr:dTMP kinase [Anderseniella sp.]